MKDKYYKIGMFVSFTYGNKLIIREVLGKQQYSEGLHLIVSIYKDFAWVLRVLPPEVELSPKLLSHPTSLLNYVEASKVKPMYFFKKE